MQIKDLLKPQSVIIGGNPKDKWDAIHQMALLMDASGNLAEVDLYEKNVIERENSGTTGLGDGIATPHAKSKSVLRAGLSAMTVPGGIDFNSLDNRPARLLFMIAAPDSAEDEHIAILSRLATMIMDATFKESLIAAKDKEEFLRLLDEKERNTFAARENKKEDAPSAKAPYRVLAVTGCPTGIAHTFMAAESLAKCAQKRGISIKVETNGSEGAKNVLTDEEIKNAAVIIVASDKNVPMERFKGKPVLIVKVSDGINKADDLLDTALGGKVPIYGAEKDSPAGDASEQGESLSRQIYKHLMNGVSHMLPFVVGGGILIALSFLFDDYAANPANFGSNTPVAKFFKDVGGAAFGFMLPALSGYIAASIADRPGLAVGFVGGALAGITGSGFLGALIAGFVAGYGVNWLKKLFANLPHSLDGVKPVLIYPFFGTLVIGLVSMFILGPVVGSLNTWLISALAGMGDTGKVLLGVIVAGMMAIDMGGPINKAAYVTGTGLLASGEYHVMAAVMAGGMVPPLSIALSTTFFPNRFTPGEKKAGLTNYLLGLSFITEGAIPFAASDPVRVLPSCILGSAVAGGLTMAFDCTLRAPHGGIFVVPTIGNPVMYLLAIFTGALVGCLLLALLKPSVSREEDEKK